jgi:hypothetical protein
LQQPQAKHVAAMSAQLGQVELQPNHNIKKKRRQFRSDAERCPHCWTAPARVAQSLPLTAVPAWAATLARYDPSTAAASRHNRAEFKRAHERMVVADGWITPSHRPSPKAAGTVLSRFHRTSCPASIE